MKYEPLPHWFKYTEFRAFLREAEVDKVSNIGIPHNPFHCPLCSFIEAQPSTGRRSACACVAFKEFQVAGKVFKMPQWAERFQKEAINQYKMEKFLLDVGMSAKEALDILCKTGAFAK